MPICVYAAGYRLFSKKAYADFLYSIDRQNYTNYHIVYVDDNSPENEVDGIIEFIQQSNFNFKNKIKIISNQQHLGAAANMYFWINKYCN